MNTYTQAVEKLGNRDRRKLENNTYLEKRDGIIAVKLHATDVVTYYPDGRIVLNSGGWRTVTTKDRLNTYSPLRVWTERGVWYVSSGEYVKNNVFKDGVCYNTKTGKLSGTLPPPKNLNKDKKRIGDYARKYVEALKAGKIPAPSAGDCFYCGMVTEDGTPLGEKTKDRSHIEMHLEENYFVPSLAYRALETFGGSICAKDTLYRLTHGELIEHYGWEDIGLEQIRTMIRRYISRQLGYQA